MDRAEYELQNLLQQSPLSTELRTQALSALLDIKQEFADWLQAIDLADQLTGAKFAQQADIWRKMQAQFCCELAEQARNKNNQAELRQRLVDALRYDPDCIRARLIEAQQHLSEGDKRAALIALDDALQRSPNRSSQYVALYQQCFADEPDNLVKVLSSLCQRQPSARLLLLISELMLKHGQADDIADYWRRVLPELPLQARWYAVIELLFKSNNSVHINEALQALRLALGEASLFHCQHCGFEHHEYAWRCSACHHWDSLRAS